jgi:hypothetical protein
MTVGAPLLSYQLFHWTRSSNLASIMAKGLDPVFATGKLKAIWGCLDIDVNWAIEHVMSRHSVIRPSAMSLLTFQVNPSHLRRHHNKDGKVLYNTSWIIAPRRIAKIDIYTVATAAVVMGLPETTLRDKYKAKQIAPSIVVNGTPLFMSNDLVLLPIGGK